MNSKITKLFGIISLLSISLVSTARSEGLTFSVGNFDHSDDNKNAAMFQLDYDFDKTLFGSPVGDFKPVVGFLVTDDNAKYSRIFIAFPQILLNKGS